MINEERVKLMTRMASYEQSEMRKDRSVIGFFKSDYISLELVKSAVATTVACFVLLGLYVMYDFELFMKEIYQVDLLQFLRTLLFLYLAIMGISMALTFAASQYRYRRSRERAGRYYNNLKILSRIYGAGEGEYD